MASVNDLDHRQLEADVKAYAESNGWLVGEGTYHSAMPEATKEALRQIDAATALYVRGRSDRVAVRGDQCVLWETKTTGHPTSSRIAIEALPLATHIELSRLYDVTVVYICRLVGCQFESAFTADFPPEPSEFIVPTWRWTHTQQAWFKRIIQRVWPETPVSLGDFSRGSGDPFGWFYQDALRVVDVNWRLLFGADSHESQRRASVELLDASKSILTP